MLKLPHKPPILFVRNVLSKEDDSAVVDTLFPKIPSLAMMMEAAAQSSCVFGDEDKEGFVISCQNVTLHGKPKGVSFKTHVACRLKNGLLSEIFFESRENDILIASGTLLLMLSK
ncbi:MAG: hypothetical protein LBH45_01215 [Campylobacteraceae bacterium]|nr:hypothetical protein [Campylobacteraceae bacterium]